MATLKFGRLTAKRPKINATHNFTSGWSTFGQVIPKGTVPSGSAVKVGLLDTQTDVKTTWSDGSARFAVITCKPTTTSDQTLTTASPGAGTFTPTIPTASVELTISGTVWTAELPGVVSSDLWLDGPHVKEWRDVVIPINPSSSPHPVLRVYYDTRVYSDGQARVDITVENLIDVEEGTKITYDVDITVDGESVFSQASVNHYFLTRWRKVFGVGLTESTMVIDFEPCIAAKAIPRYSESVSDLTYSTSGDAYGIMREGGLNPAMATTGGRPEIAPYPDWTARFLAHQSSSQRNYVLKQGDLGGSWPIHIRESDESLVSIDDRPDFWLDTRGVDQPAGDISNTGNTLVPDLAHVPSISYIPYLVTGDRYHMDELAFWGNFSLLNTWPYDGAYPGLTRNREEGLLRAEQTRGIAWGLRNLTHAAAYVPDNHQLKSYYAEKVQNNLDWFDEHATNNNTPLGVAWWTIRTVPPPHMSIALWEYNYLAWSIDHSNKQGFTGGLTLRNQIVSFQLELFTSSEFPAESEYPGAYLFAIGEPDGSGGTNFYTTLTQVFDNSFVEGDNTHFSGYYGKNIRLLLMIAVDQGYSGAEDALAFLETFLATDMVNDAGWSISAYV